MNLKPTNEVILDAESDVCVFPVQVEEGWWSGTLNGKSGLFPSNFVKELETSGEEGEPADTVADETGGEDTHSVV